MSTLRENLKELDAAWKEFVDADVAWRNCGRKPITQKAAQKFLEAAEEAEENYKNLLFDNFKREEFIQKLDELSALRIGANMVITAYSGIGDEKQVFALETLKKLVEETK